MGKASRDKGARFERTIVNAMQDAGLAAERVPLSGAAGGSFSGDITCPVQGEDRLFEAKKRADGFREIYRWIEGNYGLVIASDRRAPLVVLSLDDFMDLARSVTCAECAGARTIDVGGLR